MEQQQKLVRQKERIPDSFGYLFSADLFSPRIPRYYSLLQENLDQGHGIGRIFWTGSQAGVRLTTESSRDVRVGRERE